MASFPSLLFLLSDGIQGHVSQSRGVAGWISRFTGADVVEMEVPRFSGWGRIRLLKIKSLLLPKADSKKAEKWLCQAGGGGLLRSAREKLVEINYNPGTALFLSAGNGAAPFALALAKATGQKCCTIMTPTTLGTAPFNFAIIPEHDYPRSSPNLLVTLGAPNMIREDLLRDEGSSMLSRFPSEKDRRWGILIGGDDANYAIPPSWVGEVLLPLLEEAEIRDVEVYMTTSRRTLPETEGRIEEAVRGLPHVRMLVLGARDPWNPVPGMLGACERIFCTEDSVSMISEASTGGHVVQILRVGRQGGIRKALQDLTAKMVGKKLLPPQRLWGIPRFNLMIESFCGRGLAMEYDPERIDEKPLAHGKINEDLSFNEARRAAEWIIQGWKS
ncbi:MAG TPA: ELM1/GtrOC1 family putative glycosyltransferase [Synergistales bacterium]|nr:ELM1/GtrOC1 family putative glycosyltransferase [Synergistales bacterium]HPK41948.1 ELM1/GtrOC1 family putative glycosyltransferase [Synergistales bacterium]